MLNHIEFFYFNFFFVILFIISLFLVIISFIFAPFFFDNEKASMYECGFEPFQDARIKFEIHFYTIAILFLIFDLELLYILIWALLVERLDFYSFFSMIYFLGSLVFGYYFEWKAGLLNWTF